jgi:hypothetical protein
MAIRHGSSKFLAEGKFFGYAFLALVESLEKQLGPVPGDLRIKNLRSEAPLPTPIRGLIGRDSVPTEDLTD